MEIYDKNTAYRYDYIRGTGHSFKRRVENIVNLIRKLDDIKRIAEVGCGTGALSYFLSKEFVNFKIDGNDLNEGFIEYAKENYKNNNLKYFKLDIEKSKIKNRYDVVITVHTLHHLKNLKKTIINIRKMLRCGGHWIIIEHNNNNFYVFISLMLMKNEGIFFQNASEKLISKYFDIIEKRNTMLMPSFIKNPSNTFKFIERKLERVPFMSGDILYLLRRKDINESRI